MEAHHFLFIAGKQRERERESEGKVGILLSIGCWLLCIETLLLPSPPAMALAVVVVKRNKPIVTLFVFMLFGSQSKWLTANRFIVCKYFSPTRNVIYQMNYWHKPKNSGINRMSIEHFAFIISMWIYCIYAFCFFIILIYGTHTLLFQCDWWRTIEYIAVRKLTFYVAYGMRSV